MRSEKNLGDQLSARLDRRPIDPTPVSRFADMVSVFERSVHLRVPGMGSLFLTPAQAESLGSELRLKAEAARTRDRQQDVTAIDDTPAPSG